MLPLLRSALLLSAVLLLLPGCYQAQITTDRAPSDTVVEEKWVASYLNGLVAAKVDVSEDCPDGIAAAERNFSFLNGLVSTITLGIYLPHTVTITCAANVSSSATTSAGPPVLTVTDATHGRR